MTEQETSNVVLAKRGMAYGPQLLLPVEVKGSGRGSFICFRMDCDEQEPGTCGTTTRQCAICCVAPIPRFTGEAARVLLDLLRRDATGLDE
jgi:hypothetical protein